MVGQMWRNYYLRRDFPYSTGISASGKILFSRDLGRPAIPLYPVSLHVFVSSILFTVSYILSVSSWNIILKMDNYSDQLAFAGPALSSMTDLRPP